MGGNYRQKGALPIDARAEGGMLEQFMAPRELSGKLPDNYPVNYAFYRPENRMAYRMVGILYVTCYTVQ